MENLAHILVSFLPPSCFFLILGNLEQRKCMHMRFSFCIRNKKFARKCVKFNMQTREREAQQIVTHSCNTGLLFVVRAQP